MVHRWMGGMADFDNGERVGSSMRVGKVGTVVIGNAC